MCVCATDHESSVPLQVIGELVPRVRVRVRARVRVRVRVRARVKVRVRVPPGGRRGRYRAG